MASLEFARTIDINEEAQEEIEDIAANLSQAYGFDFPLELLEKCYGHVQDTTVVRIIAVRVQQRINIDPDDIFEDDRMVRHMQRLERAFQFFIDEHLS